ncbi:MAG: class I SAM-dependent methyltransferase [Acidipropionibacterium sp.]|nr:class I SAM-dependent methyltransferase [Acidipropionibacterium sp.]
MADVECGAGALARELDDGRRRVIGIEDSAPELETAMGTGSQFISWVRGSVDNLPLADHSMDAVVTSMGMVTVPDPRLLVDEASRVLRPGGVFACMAPTIRPLPMALARQAAALTARVGSTPSFPGALELRMTDLLAQRGLRKVEDARSCYVFTVRDAADADLIINAMYLPGSTPARRRSARDWLVRRAQDKGQVELPIPMRRVVALKDPEPASAIV